MRTYHAAHVSSSVNLNTPPSTHRARAAVADPFGDRVHVILFVLFGLLLPIGGIPWAKEVVFGAIIVWCVLRATVGRVAYAWTSAWHSPLIWLIFGWMAWSALSITWSHDPTWGADQWKGLRLLLIPILFWPVAHRWRSALAAFTAGGTVIAIIVIAQAFDWIGMEWAGSRPMAFMGYCGGVLAATSAAHFGFTLTQPGRWSVVWHLAGLAITLLALIFNETRSAWLGVLLAAMLTVLVVVGLRATLRARALLIVTAILTGLAIATTIDAGLLESQGANRVAARLERAVQEFEEPTGKALWRSPNRGSARFRLRIWNAIIVVSKQRPIAGWGLGGISHAIQDYPGLTFAKRGAITDHQYDPHSSYLYQMGSTGYIGLLLMLGTLLTAIWLFVTRIRCDATLVVPLAMLSVWIVGSVFESSILSGTAVGLLGLSLAAAATPSREAA